MPTEENQASGPKRGMAQKPAGLAESVYLLANVRFQMIFDAEGKYIYRSI
jgi:hypothetical protein